MKKEKFTFKKIIKVLIVFLTTYLLSYLVLNSLGLAKEAKMTEEYRVKYAELENIKQELMDYSSDSIENKKIQLEKLQKEVDELQKQVNEAKGE